MSVSTSPQNDIIHPLLYNSSFGVANASCLYSVLIFYLRVRMVCDHGCGPAFLKNAFSFAPRTRGFDEASPLVSASQRISTLRPDHGCGLAFFQKAPLPSP